VDYEDFLVGLLKHEEMIGIVMVREFIQIPKDLLGFYDLLKK